MSDVEKLRRELEDVKRTLAEARLAMAALNKDRMQLEQNARAYGYIRDVGWYELKGDALDKHIQTRINQHDQEMFMQSFDLAEEAGLVSAVKAVRNFMLAYSWVEKTMNKVLERLQVGPQPFVGWRNWLDSIIAGAHSSPEQAAAAKVLYDYIPPEKHYLHVKTNGLYRYWFAGTLEEDGRQLVAYQSLKDNRVWFRDSKLFFDGRFRHDGDVCFTPPHMDEAWLYAQPPEPKLNFDE